MKTFTLKIEYLINGMLAWTLLVIILFFLVITKKISLINGDGLLTVILVLLIFRLVIKAVSSAKTEWSLSDEGITIRWVSVFSLLRKPDLQINWNEIQNFNYCKAYGVNNRYSNCAKLTFKLSKWRVITFNFYQKDSNKAFNELIEYVDEKIKDSFL